MSKTLNLNIISAEKTLFSGEVAFVQFPGTSGGFSIHPDHAPLISSLKEGELSYQKINETSLTDIEIKGGFVEVVKNVVTVCVS